MRENRSLTSKELPKSAIIEGCAKVLKEHPQSNQLNLINIWALSKPINCKHNNKKSSVVLLYIDFKNGCLSIVIITLRRKTKVMQLEKAATKEYLLKFKTKERHFLECGKSLHHCSTYLYDSQELVNQI